MHTPPRQPQTNGIAERWIRSARQEYLDHLLILNERRLRHVLTEYVAFHNERRPHQGLGQQCPIPLPRPPSNGPILQLDVLGGIIHDYHRQVA